MQTLLPDRRYAARTLARRPAYAAVAVSTLALGIGATTSVFGVVHAALLRPPGCAGGSVLGGLSARG